MLDTDTASYAIKRKNDAVLQRLSATLPADICISAISHAELFFGLDISPNRQRDEELCFNFLSYIRVLPFGPNVSRHYGEIRGHLKRTGKLIGGNDMLLAAHARSEQLVFVTNNVREYERVPGLRIENWTEPVRW